MTSSTRQREYSIKEAATLTGLPASTLRYYESIGVIEPVSRGASSKHRVFTDEDLDQIMWIACLAAIGLSVKDMRRYVANGMVGPTAALGQVEILQAQQARLAVEAEVLAVRQRYVALKIDYWRAVDAGDDDRVEQLAADARALADELKRTRRSP